MSAPKKAAPDRLLQCPVCKHTLLYCDGEPTPAILYRFGTRTETTNETGLGTPIGCERCIFAYKRRTKQDESPQAGRASPAGRPVREPPTAQHPDEDDSSYVYVRDVRARGASPPASPQGMPRRHEASPSPSPSSALADDSRSVKQMLREDVGGVVELLEEGVEVIDRARSFVRKIFPKP